LSVHLQAQAKPGEPPFSEKKTSAAAALKRILAEHKIPLHDELLQSRIDSVSSADTLTEAISNFLTEDVKVEKEVANKVLDEAKAALGTDDSGLPVTLQVLESVVDATHPVFIRDVHTWKASMRISSGVKPVRSLEELVEVAEKL
jgi:insulysin